MTAAAVIVSLLILLAAVATFFSLYAANSQNASVVTRRATDYLVANYNPSIGMIPETPKGNTYFVYSDNFLAAFVLGRSGNSTLRIIAANITATDNKYLAMVPDPKNQYQVISSSNGSFFASNNYVLARVGSSVIETTLNNGTSTLSPSGYADIAFLEALYWHQVHGGYVLDEFTQGAKLFDRLGFKDQAFNGTYQTYKLALYDYVGKIVGVALPRGLEANLTRLQAPDGGFYTRYVPDFSTNGTTTNTETSSLAILALSTPAPQQYSPYLPVFLSAIAVVVLAEALVVRRRSRRRRTPSDKAALS
jgi:hypothetical protein